MVALARSYTLKREGSFKLRSKEGIIKYALCSVKDTYNLILKVVIFYQGNHKGFEGEEVC